MPDYSTPTTEEVQAMIDAAGVGNGANIKSGEIHLGAGATVDVEFATPFVATIPQVVVTPGFYNTKGAITYYVYSITLSGFRIRGADNPVGLVNWIATNAGNP